MLTKELIKIGLCLTGGLILAIAAPIGALGGWNYLLLPLYILGFIYGISTILPWIGKTIGSTSKMFMYSVIMKSLIGVLLLLLLLPVFIAILLTVGWIIGIVKLVQRLAEAIQLEGSLHMQRGSLHSDRRRRSGHGRDKENPYEFFDDEEDYGREQLGDGRHNGGYDSDHYNDDYDGSDYNFDDEDI